MSKPISHEENLHSSLRETISRQEKEIARLKNELHTLQKKLATPYKKLEEIYSLREIINLIPGNVYWKNEHGVYLGCNNNLSKIMGLNSPDDILGKRNSDLMEATLAELADNTDKEILLRGTELCLEEAGFDIKKESAVYLSKKIPLYNTAGIAAGILGISMDITERKKMEVDLKNAKEKAEAFNRAKSQFLAIVNHELRTPLTSILGLISFLKDDELLLEEKINALNDLENCSQNLLCLVNDVLDFSQLEAGKYQLNETSVDLTILVNQVISIVTTQAKAKGLELFLSLNHNPNKVILTDALILRQMLINIVSNAIKFTNSGHIYINIYQVSCDAETSEIKISVHDTGQGIPADKIDLIFKPFQQLEDTYKRESSRSGTGLGLAIVKQLSKLIGTQIQVTSELGNGTHFSLAGKFVTQDVVREEKSREKIEYLSKQTSDDKATNKLKVLLVEDNEIVQRVHHKMLTELGCSVDAVTYGKEALLRLKEHDMVFVDIGLPDITGFEVIKAIRERQYTTEKLPVIALTAYTREEERLACLHAGANEVASKPISSHALKNIIASYYGDRGVGE